ncbi:MAG: N-acetyltransferase family protein [Thiohalomonadales bacterium]
MIRHATENDIECIAGIYNHYIQNTVVTFEEEMVSFSDINSRIARDAADGLPWLVAVDEGEIIGYAYATAWSTRSAYRFTVETTVYLSSRLVSKGWGSKLYESLFQELKEMGIHVVIGGITLPNEASIALHEKFGMYKVAHFKKVGSKFGKWHDVGYWQVEISA